MFMRKEPAMCHTQVYLTGEERCAFQALARRSE